MANLTKQELEAKHDLYQQNVINWQLYELVWRSGKDLIDFALYRHPRESPANYKARLKDGYIFNFGKSIIDIFNFYLHEKKSIRNLPGLKDDRQWQMFQKDADLQGTNYNVLIDEVQKFASVFGAFGTLVNKPGGLEGTLDAEIKNGIYPYYALYSPLNIYDWEWKKNKQTHRNELVYLKLKEPGENYLLWWMDHWEQWSLENKTKKPMLADSGDNELEEIPFVWMLNIKDLAYPQIGSSDLVDIANIVISITQNLSCGEEMIKLAGFPIRRQPMSREDDDLSASDDEVETGPRAVEEFDPEFGANAKPDWMPTEILEPVEATLKWIDRKSDEIYRIAHLSGVHGQRKSNNEVASGMALRYEFSQLNEVLNAKSVNQTEAELQMLRLWLKWQGKEKLIEEVEIRRSTEFSIDDLSVALENAITSFRNVVSKTFRVRVMEKIVEHVLPDVSQADKEKISKEIEDNVPDKIEIEQRNSATDSNISKFVRNANQSKADHSKDNEKKYEA